MKFLYAPKYRPPGIATCPPGWSLVERGTGGHFPLRSDLPEGDYVFGVIQYAGPLTDDEIESFDLEPIGRIELMDGGRVYFELDLAAPASGESVKMVLPDRLQKLLDGDEDGGET